MRWTRAGAGSLAAARSRHSSMAPRSRLRGAGDSGELILAAQSLGSRILPAIRLDSLRPRRGGIALGTVALRVNAVSALLSACAVVFSIFSRPVWPQEVRRLAATLIFAGSTLLWDSAVQAESTRSPRSRSWRSAGRV